MMIAQIMQRLFGPVLQGNGPNADAPQGAATTGAFAQLMTEGDDSPLVPVNATEEAVVAKTALEPWMENDSLPEAAFVQGPLFVGGEPPVSQRQDAAPAVGLADQALPQTSTRQTAIALNKWPTSPVPSTGLPATGEPDSGVATDAMLFGGPVLKPVSAPIAHGDERKPAIALDAGLLAQGADPTLPAHLDAATSERLLSSVIPAASQPSGSASPHAPVAGIGADADSVSIGQPAAQQPGETADLPVPIAAKASVAEGQTPVASYRVALMSPPVQLPIMDGERLVASAALALPERPSDLPAPSLVQPVAARAIPPATVAALAALQALAKGGSEATEGAPIEEELMAEPTLSQSASARNMAAIYAPSAQIVAQMPSAMAAAVASQWTDAAGEVGDMLLGEGAVASLGFGDGRGALPPLHSSAISTAGALVAGQAPNFAQISAQIMPLAKSAQSGPVELVLSPAELGQLRFEIHQRGDQVQIVLSAERPETLDLLRRNGEQLLNDFRNAGFAGASLSFGGWGTGQNNSGAAPQDFWGDGQAAVDIGPASSAAQAAHNAPFARPTAYLDTSRSLNLRL